MTELYLEVRGVSKNFGELQAVQQVSMEVQKGEVVSIIGPSGSGKSTLLRCINQLEIIDRASRLSPSTKEGASGSLRTGRFIGASRSLAWCFSISISFPTGRFSRI